MKNSWWWLIGGVVCVGAVVLASSMRQQQDAVPVAGPDIAKNEQERGPREVKTPSLSEALGVDDSDMVEIGGIKRPKRDVVKSTVDPIREREKYLAALPKVGKAPIVPADTSETTKRLSKDLKDPEKQVVASSVFGKSGAFNRETYLQDPDAYLLQTRPGRAFSSLPVAEDTVPIEYSSAAHRQILQGESVFIEARAEPGMPVTFHTQQLGEFDNRLKTISVAASKDGIAKVKYTAVSGVAGPVRILAASPVHSGRLLYLVDVAVPN